MPSMIPACSIHRHPPGRALWLLSCLLGVLATFARTASGAAVDYVSDRAELILSSSQDWGVLGLDLAAHLPDRAGESLRIGAQTYAKGLGSHAHGTIQLLLDGEYELFQADVGLQPCGGGGSVVFRVRVDGEVRFESPILRAGDTPASVRVPVAGAQELVLESTDAGDGITCDMANWADARLIRSSTPSPKPTATEVDMARFARIVTSDPNRVEGTRASRIEEFPEADLFLETDLPPDKAGTFLAPATSNGLACIGLEWLNRRALKELELGFLDASLVPATNRVRVEGWFGESHWQGRWLGLQGELERQERTLRFKASPRSPTGGLLLTSKVRWVWPVTTAPVRVRRPAAFTRSRWTTADLFVQFETPVRAPEGFAGVRRTSDGRTIGVLNGEIVGPPNLDSGKAQPQPFSVRYSRPAVFKSDPTLLQVSLPWDQVAVAVQDILDNEAVYLPDFGVLFCRADRPVSLPGYKDRIRGRQTLLEEVRQRPDQTLAQAMATTHHPAQREGPVMLSLACDNAKFVVERSGIIRSQWTTNQGADWFSTAGEIRPRFGDEPLTNLERHLDGGWLPVPVITVRQQGLVWSERCFVAPWDPLQAEARSPQARAVCVAEFTVTNPAPGAARCSLALDFQGGRATTTPVRFEPDPRGFVVLHDGRPVALLDTRGCQDHPVKTVDSGARVAGVLPPGGTARLLVYLPASPVAAEDLASLAGAERLRSAAEAYWRGQLASAMQIETPEPFLNDLIRSSQVRCLIAARNEADGARIAPWIAAMSYGPLESEAHSVLRGMDFFGHRDFTRRGLEYFVHRYNTNGFLTTGYTTFGTAWHLWTLGEHCQLTGDTNWLRQVAPEVKRVGRWIMAQTAKTRNGRVAGPDDSLSKPAWRRQPGQLAPAPGRVAEFGLMPPGVLADWNAYAYHFCLNAYYAAALRETGKALRLLGDGDGPRFEDAGLALGRETAESFRLTRSAAPAVPLRNGTWVPYYPSQVHAPGRLGDFFPGEDAGRSWCYDVELGAHQLVPTGVLDPFDEAVDPMLQHMEDVQFLADGWFDYAARDNARDWFNLGGFSKVQPYYTRNCEVYALRDDVKPFVRSYFNTLAAMVNPEVLTFWEHFHHSGAWDKTHETGYFLHQTRTMFIQERGAELWLGPMLPSRWLENGRTVGVRNAPTRFGPISFRLDSHLAAGWIDVEIEPPSGRQTFDLVLRLRHPDGRPIREVTLNGARHRNFDAAQDLIRMSPAPGTLRVRAGFGPGPERSRAVR